MLLWCTLLLLFLLLAVTLWPAGPAATAPDSGFFFDSFEEVGSGGWEAAAGDVDGDGDLDLYMANDGPDAVWINQGGAQGDVEGEYADSGQSLGDFLTVGVALGDVDGDGDLDAVVLNNSMSLIVVFVNQGGAQGGTPGQFSDSGQTLEEDLASAVALGDVDGDGDLDAFVARNIGRANKVWLNQGGDQGGTAGEFGDSGQTLGSESSSDAALGDVDGDGDLDAFVADGGPNHVWINQGGAQSGTAGAFEDSGQVLGDRFSLSVALGDVDGDGDVDAYVGNNTGDDDALWINEGGAQGGTEGDFADSGQTLAAGATRDVALGDVDGDGDADAFLARAGANAVWINQGGDQGGAAGVFQESQQIGDDFSEAVALGDADGDGDLDAFVANPYAPNRLLTNGEAALPTAAFDVEREVNDGGDEVAYWAQGGGAMLPIVLSHPVTQTVDVYVRVEGPGPTMTETLSFAAGEQLQLLNLENPAPDPSETFTLILRVAPGGTPPAGSVETDRLLFVFVDGAQGPRNCFLCYVEWLGRLLDVDPALWSLHHADLGEREASPQWDYYSALFGVYAPQMSDLVARHPSLLWSSIGVLNDFKPAVQALESGDAGYTIDQSLAEGMDGFFEDMAAEAGPGLQAAVEQERAALDLPAFAGLTMDEAWDHLVAQRPIDQAYVTVILK